MPPVLTTTRRGVINVPLFSTPYTLPVGITANAFRRYSYYPQCNGGNSINSIPQNVGIINTVQMAIPGPANVLATTQTGSSGGSGGGPIFLGQSLDGGGVISSPSENVFFSVRSTPLNGAQDAYISQSKFVQQPVLTAQGMGNIIAYDNQARVDGTIPFWDPTQGPAGGIMTGVVIVIVAFGSAITGQYLRHPDLTYQQQDMFDLGISWNSLAANVIYYQCPAKNGLVYGFFDTNNNQPPYTIPRQICAYRPAPFTGSPPPPLQNYTPAWDDASLQNVMNGHGSGYTLDIWPGGWIIKLGTGGLGPTGQPEEIAITDPGMTTYNLLRFVPQDNAAQVQFNHATTFGWQVKIDPNGVVYFNSGAPADANKVLYSYSPVRFLYPQFAYTPGFISLPCYTPCDAVTVYPEG